MENRSGICSSAAQSALIRCRSLWMANNTSQLLPALRCLFLDCLSRPRCHQIRSRMSLAQGARLSSYEILELLGRGGMGEVYRGRDTKLGRDVAIKALPSAFAQDVERLARFE